MARKMLIIDEDGTRLGLMERLLAAHGRQACRVDSSDIALALLENDVFFGEHGADIVIVGPDVQNGHKISLARLIKQTCPETSVLLSLRPWGSCEDSNPLHSSVDKVLRWSELMAELRLVVR